MHTAGALAIGAKGIRQSYMHADELVLQPRSASVAEENRRNRENIQHLLGEMGEIEIDGLLPGAGFLQYFYNPQALKDLDGDHG
jgi:hypothetical protein